MPFSRSQTQPTVAGPPQKGILLPSLVLRSMVLNILVTYLPLVVFRIAFEKINGTPPTLEDLAIIIPTFIFLSGAVIYYYNKKAFTSVFITAKILEQAKPGDSIPALPKAKSKEVSVLFHAITESFARNKALLDERRDLVTLLSHDLASPATQAKGILQLIASDTLLSKEERNNLLEKLSLSADHQLEIIRSLLSLMRMDIAEQGNHAPIAIGPLVSEAVLRVDNLAKAKNIDIVSENSDKALPISPFLFTQCVENLLSNAIKFSQNGQSIHVTTITTATHLGLQVADNGIGFNEEQAARLFQESLVAGQTGTAGEKSNGLGLYLIQKVAQRHQGWVEATSPGPSLGATFTFWLPLA